MTAITTTINITLTHGRKLTADELENLAGSITEHIVEEHGKDPGDWGFSDITEVAVHTAHELDPDDGPTQVLYGPLSRHLTFEPEPAA